MAGESKVPDIDVCICSYRRPEIVETLAALSLQAGSHSGRFRVVVADNTLLGESRELVLRVARELQLELHYVHAPADNISVARNACLEAARGRWIAFLDDDETPAPNWLATLLEEVERGRWDAVLGPVIAIYPNGTPRWLSQGDFHSTRPVWINGRIETAYTGNVIFRRNFAEQFELRFRLELGKTGGEDEDFFYRFYDVGGRIGFAPEAVAYEHVDLKRADITWLLRRNFRAGQSHGTRLRYQRRAFANIFLAAAKAGVCTLGAVVNLTNASRRSRYLIRAALHCGVVARLSGIGEIRMY